ncbi:MAG: hypothetical protein QF441_01775 [Bacteriovoracaceae bacterium]|jgi:DNA-binding HxlR family transcriptional regulator|nr:hypothetical protein [Bacteriovoracaceae bacterium]|tara:strand:+ start:210 stop:683 length:474 start_codon:yes stop_codon:yes gene_type:complete
MSFNLTIVERMILESLLNKQLKKEQIMTSTGLNQEIVNHSLSDLIIKSLVRKEDHYYRLNSLNSALKQELTNLNNVTTELTEIVHSCLNLKQKSQAEFKMRKVYLSPKDEKLFYGMLYNIESFLNGLNQTNNNLTEKTVFFWGSANYEKISNNIINS